MRHLWRMAVWGGTAAAALFVVVLSGHSEVGSQRIATALSSLHGRGGSPQLASRTFDAKTETQRLSEALHRLAVENEQLRSRLAGVEQNMDSITGSITKLEAGKAAKPVPQPATEAPSPVSVATIVVPPAPEPAPAAGPPLPAAAPPPAAEAGPAPAAAAEYGVDIGSALSIQVLRARWLGIRSAHPQLFEGLTPTAMLREIPQTNRVELRLVVGPLADSEAAKKLCASLAPYRLYCQPTVFDRQRAAL
jgi:hypothetical protein